MHIHGEFRAREQSLHILGLGRVGHITDIETTALRDGLGDVGAGPAEREPGGECLWAGRTGTLIIRAVLALRAPVCGIERTPSGSDPILDGGSRSYGPSVIREQKYGFSPR